MRAPDLADLVDLADLAGLGFFLATADFAGAFVPEDPCMAPGEEGAEEATCGPEVWQPQAIKSPAANAVDTMC